MQITFDPLNEQETEFIRKALGDQTYNVKVGDISMDLDREHLENILRGGAGVTNITNHTHAPVLAHADRPDVGASPEVQFAPSAAPLPPEVPAPSTAAAELFPTAPAAAPASVPPAPPVPSPPAVVAPVVAAALSAVAPATSPVPAGELDKNGLPWDERIHASTKAKNADGSWRQRRGLNDDALLKRIEAELRSKVAAPLAPTVAKDATETVELTQADPATNAMAPAAIPAPANSLSNVPPSAPPAPSAATAVVPPPPVIPAGPSVVPAPPVPAGAPTPITPTAPPAAPPASTRGPLSFGDMMSKLITRNIAAGLLKEEQVHAIMARPGVDLQPTQIGVLAGDAFKRQLVVDGLRELNLPEE